MSSLSTGASRRVPAAPRLSASRAARRPADLGRPGARWQRTGNPLGRALLRSLHAVALWLEVWEQRIRDREQLERLPDYLLRDIGIDAGTANQEARKPFWRA